MKYDIPNKKNKVDLYVPGYKTRHNVEINMQNDTYYKYHSLFYKTTKLLYSMGNVYVCKRLEKQWFEGLVSGVVVGRVLDLSKCIA